MSLLKLDISAVRNIRQLSIQPSPAINFIFGANASGKSAFLEAIYLLGRAKSFRSPNIKPVIDLSSSQLMVSALTLQNNGHHCQLGIRMDGKEVEIRVNQQPTDKRSDLAYALPLQLIYPKSYELLDAGPGFRREFLDWGVFNEFAGFLPAWRNFKKALAHRNALLKSKTVGSINVWNKELVEYGTIVNDYRLAYLQKLTPVFLEISQQFMDMETIQLHFLPGWSGSKSLLDELTESLEKDIRYGFTQSGPHRADFQVSVNNRSARDYMSRGQLKLLILGLKLAQVKLLTNESNHSVIVLIDDFSAELDVVNRARLLAYLSKMNCQTFITATGKTEFGDLAHLPAYKMFHMEHGQITQV